MRRAQRQQNFAHHIYRIPSHTQYPKTRSPYTVSVMTSLPSISKWNVPKWYKENEELFAPPVCNKLMHKDQLTVMFVGGPNTRTDFHIEHGSEFFFQMRGNIELPTIQRGKRKVVKIREGQVFLLPSRIPHSPQRPEEGSFGLVVERRRDKHELDGLRFYTDFDTCDDILWEKYIHCWDLGRDLVPVIEEYRASEEFKTGRPTGKYVSSRPPTEIDTQTVVPDPFSFSDWLKRNDRVLQSGKVLNLFENHPDNEFHILVAGGNVRPESRKWQHETWLYQHRGDAIVEMESQSGDKTSEVLGSGDCCVVPANCTYLVRRSPGSVGLIVFNDPLANKGSKRAKY